MHIIRQNEIEQTKITSFVCEQDKTKGICLIISDLNTDQIKLTHTMSIISTGLVNSDQPTPSSLLNIASDSVSNIVPIYCSRHVTRVINTP